MFFGQFRNKVLISFPNEADIYEPIYNNSHLHLFLNTIFVTIENDFIEIDNEYKMYSIYDTLKITSLQFS